MEVETDVPMYAPLLELSTHDLNMHELREYLERYSIERKQCEWTGPTFEDTAAQWCHQNPEIVLDACQQLDELAPVARYLFSRFALRKRAFEATACFKLPYPETLRACLDDSTRMARIVQTLTTELNRVHDGDGASTFEANVMYIRPPGFAVFSIDRCDRSQASSLVQMCTVYSIDIIPCLYVVPYLTRTNVICEALQVTFGCPMVPEQTVSNVPLYRRILDDAAQLHLEADHFTEQLKHLLYFQDGTLRRMDNEASCLMKYSSMNLCPFDSVTFQFTEQFRLVVKAKPGQSVLDVLYEKERNNEMVVPENIIKELADGNRCIFYIEDLRIPQDHPLRAHSSGMVVRPAGSTRNEQGNFQLGQSGGEPGPSVPKYPSEHACQFKSVTFVLGDDIKLVVEASRDQNILDVLHEMERQNEITVRDDVIQALANGECHVFSLEEPSNGGRSASRRAEREPSLVKYPSVHACSFNSVTFELGDGLKLLVKAKNDGNILEVLYGMERNKKIVVPNNIIRDLADAKTNVFHAEDLSG